MQIKLIKKLPGKHGDYEADVWYPARDIDGFIFITHSKEVNKQTKSLLKLVARSNIKEIKDGPEIHSL